MSVRARKKPRPSAEHAYHDFVPLASHDYHDVHVHEERLIKTGVSAITTPASACVLHKSDNHWNSSSSWVVLDDPEFALDPHDGEWYDEAVDQPVMQDNCPTVFELITKKKRKERSKVSVCSMGLFPSLQI